MEVVIPKATPLITQGFELLSETGCNLLKLHV